MSRFTCLVVATALLLAVATGADPDVCSGYKHVFTVEKGAITDGPGIAAAADAAELLAAGIAAEVHKDEECVVAADFTVEKACRRAVKKGQVLKDSGFELTHGGMMHDMQITSTITCPDGSYTVRYQARGVKQTTHPDELFDIQTRFMDVIDSTYA